MKIILCVVLFILVIVRYLFQSIMKSKNDVKLKVATSCKYPISSTKQNREFFSDEVIPNLVQL
jgi:hypothetical protein